MTENTAIENLFLEKICSNITCGSQRCDGSHSWIQGCAKFKEFETQIHIIAAQIIREANFPK